MPDKYRTLKSAKNTKGYVHVLKDEDGEECYYLNGKQHRTDGPAFIEPRGYQHWYLNGEFHRTDGPAIIGPDGYQRWFLNDREIRHPDQVQTFKYLLDCPLTELPLYINTIFKPIVERRLKF